MLRIMVLLKRLRSPIRNDDTEHHCPFWIMALCAQKVEAIDWQPCNLSSPCTSLWKCQSSSARLLLHEQSQPHTALHTQLCSFWRKGEEENRIVFFPLPWKMLLQSRDPSCAGICPRKTAAGEVLAQGMKDPRSQYKGRWGRWLAYCSTCSSFFPFTP